MGQDSFHYCISRVICKKQVCGGVGNDRCEVMWSQRRFKRTERSFGLFLVRHLLYYVNGEERENKGKGIL